MRTAFPLAALALTLAAPFAAAAAATTQRPRLDVAFVLDTTGSMGDEIDVVKEKLVAIARRLSSGQPAPDVRFAVVAFKDRGDAYVTRVTPFDRSLEKTQQAILALTADGGGDEPEDVAAALHATLKLDWDRAPAVARVAFLVGDAGPQAYPGAPTWEQALTNFRERKITVHSIGCSGLSAGGVFKAIAERTHGDFEQLTYRRVERLAGGKTRTVLTTGGETFVADGELSESDWKRGASKLVAEGRAKKDASAGPAGLGAHLYAASARGAGGLAAATPPEAAPTNNLDEEIAGRLLRAAEAAGTSYGD